ncbi:MAG: DUF5686 family protein [Phocaeicola sp.]
MRYHLRRYWSLFLLLLTPLLLLATAGGGEEKSGVHRPLLPDSVLQGIFAHAPYYARLIDSYQAELYLKGRLTVHKKNFLLRYVPSMFTLEKGVNEYMQESLSELHYKSPDIMERKMKAITGTFRGHRGQIADLFEFLHLNAYQGALMEDKLLSPLDKRSRRYYTYRQDSVVATPQGECYKILIEPNFKSTQLVRGYMWVEANGYRLQELYIEGSYDLITFRIKARMGEVGDERLLPVYFDMGLDFKLVGNHLSMDCEAWMDYKETCFYPHESRGAYPGVDSLGGTATNALADSLVTNALKVPSSKVDSLGGTPATTSVTNALKVPSSKVDSLGGTLADSLVTNALKVPSSKGSTSNLWARVGSSLRRVSSHDLSRYYRLSCDTSALVTDRARFDSIRPQLLKPSDRAIYAAYSARRDSAQSLRQEPLTELQEKRKRRLVFWGKVGDVLISDYKMDMEKLGSLKASPLINPLLLQYSGSRGITYEQRFFYNNLYGGGKLLRISPRVGYNFSKNELYVNVESEWRYCPQKQGRFFLYAGNGNRIYSSVVLDQLKSYPDSIFSFDKFDLEYFRDVYLRMGHTIEPINGLTMEVGVTLHWRSLINKPQLAVMPPAQVYTQGGASDGLIPSVNQSGRDHTPNPMSAMDNGEAMEPLFPLEGRIRTHYNSFAPRIRIEWTPGMYYFMNGKRKMNVGSKLPTFMVDYERGLPHVLGSNGGYERIEIDMQQKVKLGAIRSIGYRLGGGMFTNQEEMYFVDFANFSHRNLPGGWNDDMSGVFQLLDGRYYNSSRQYWRANVTYESPFILLKSLNKWLGKVQQERIYGGILSMDRLHPYIELGYGVGTHLFDVGLFVSSENWTFGSVGCSFRFELFNK